MSLESATYLDDLVVANPTGTDPVNKGDDHIRLLKTVLQASFPDVDAAVMTIHSGSSAPASPQTATAWWDTANSVWKYYDGSSFVRLAANMTEAQNSSFVWAGTAGGTADALTATLTPTLTAYATGQQFAVIAASNNTGAATIDIDTIGAKDITKWGTTALEPDDMVAGRVYFITYDGTRFQLQNPSRAIASHVFEARPTLTSGTPVTTSDVTAATTIYLTPHSGNKVRIYDGSAQWKEYVLSEISIAVPAVANTMHDLFLYDNSGTLTLEAVAWTNDSTRATALVNQDNVAVKSGATDRIYVGSFRTLTSGQTEDSEANRLLCSHYNQVEKPMIKVDGTASWAYGTGAWRAKNADAGNKISAVIGIAGQTINVENHALCYKASGPGTGHIGIDLDGSSDGDTTVMPVIEAASGRDLRTAKYQGVPAAGYHYWTAMEYGAGSVDITFYGDYASLTNKNGIMGSVLV